MIFVVIFICTLLYFYVVIEYTELVIFQELKLQYILQKYEKAQKAEWI